MGNFIQTILENIDLHLKTIDGKVTASGKVVANFQCPGCSEISRVELKYQGDHPQPQDAEQKCSSCGESYNVTGDIRLDANKRYQFQVRLKKKSG